MSGENAQPVIPLVNGAPVSTGNPLPTTGGGSSSAVVVNQQSNALAPTYVEGTTNPLSGDLSGNLRAASPDAGNAAAGTGTASVTSATTIFSIDTTNYNALHVQITSAGTTCTITYEQSDDNATWLSAPGYNDLATNVNALLTTSTTTVGIIFPIKARYFRARVSTYTSGTVTAFYTLRRVYGNNNTQAYANIATINGVVPLMGNGVTGTGAQRVTVASDNTAFPVNAQLLAATTGGYSFLHIAAGQATTNVKSGAGTLHSIVLNSAATATNVTTVYDSTAASGTVIAIPAVTTATVPTALIFDIAFATGLTISTTTANGGDMTVTYK